MGRNVGKCYEMEAEEEIDQIQSKVWKDGNNKERESMTLKAEKQ